jgi:PPOX class probable F420-dependent enzyme
MPTLPLAEARRRFGAAQIARLATVRPDGRPHIVPVVFALDGDRISMVVDEKPKRSSDLQRLRNVRANPEVSVLVDCYDDDWSQLWWVRADGHARVIEAGPEHEAATRLLTAKYAPYRTTQTFATAVIIDVTGWSGWAADER